MRRLALTLFVLMLFAAQAIAAVHTLRLSDGRVLRGELVRASEDALWFRPVGEAAPVRFEINEVVSILFTSPGAETPTRGEAVTVPVGARIRVALSGEIGTGHSNVGDTFFATLKDDITVGDRVLIPKSKRVTGRVRKVVKPRRKGQRVVIELVLASVPVNGKSMTIVTDHFGVQSDGKGTMRTNGRAGIEGARLLDLMDGWNVSLKPGTVLVFHLAQPLVVR